MLSCHQQVPKSTPPEAVSVQLGHFRTYHHVQIRCIQQLQQHLLMRFMVISKLNVNLIMMGSNHPTTFFSMRHRWIMA
jgi:hypothetical protein